MYKCFMCNTKSNNKLCYRCEEELIKKLSQYINIPYKIGDKCYILIDSNKKAPEVREVAFDYNSYKLQQIIEAFKQNDTNIIHSCTTKGPCWNLFDLDNKFNRHLSQIYTSYEDCLNNNIQTFKDYLVRENTKKMLSFITDKFKNLDDNYVAEIINNKEYMDSLVYNFGEDLAKQREFKIEEYNKLKEKITKETKQEIKEKVSNEEKQAIYKEIKTTVLKDLKAEKDSLDDIFLMGQQDIIYNTIKTFLKSKEAIKFGVTGLNIKVENGYVNAEWKFSERKEKDINE